MCGGLEIKNQNLEANEDNLDMLDDNQNRHREVVDIIPDVINQSIITNDDMNSSSSDEDTLSDFDQNS